MVHFTGAVAVPVDTNTLDMVEAIAEAITERTRVIIVNSPHKRKRRLRQQKSNSIPIYISNMQAFRDFY